MFRTGHSTRPLAKYVRHLFHASTVVTMPQSAQEVLSRAKPIDVSSVSINTPRDLNTLSNYNAFVTEHIIANIDIDFAKRRLQGNVVLRLKSRSNAEADTVILDTR